MVYEEIRRYMDDRSIKQAPIARKAGMTKQKLSRSLNGKRDITADEYLEICHALEVPVNTFDICSSAEGFSDERKTVA